MKTRKVMFLAVTFAAVCARADTWTDPDTGYTWTYSINGDKAEIYKKGYYNSAAISPEPTGSLTIPATLGGKTVARIGKWTFYGCSGLTSVTIPNSVTNISVSAFRYCDRLIAFEVADENPSYKSASGLLLTKDGKTLVRGVNGDVTIPDSVTCIGEWAFSECGGLTNVIISDGVVSIEGAAFQNCHNMTNVAFGSGVRLIKSGAFAGCNGLVSVSIPDRVEQIEPSSFFGCKGILSFKVADSNPSYKSDSGLLLTKDGKKLVEGVNGDVKIPPGVTSIERDAFAGREGLIRVFIPASMANIEDAFRYCDKLMALEVAGDNPYYTSASGLLLTKDRKVLLQGVNGDVMIPDCVTSIGERAFYHYWGLTSVTIPDSVMSIGDYAFLGCGGLMSVVFKGNAPSVGKNAFSNAKNGCTAYVRRNSVGWCVEIPGTWNGLRIEYAEECKVENGFTVSQYIVPQYQLRCIADAEAAITNSALWLEAPVTNVYRMLSFSDMNYTSNFNHLPYPSNEDFNTVGFVLVANGKIHIQEAGNWSFACGSDDGFLVTISGNGISETFACEWNRSFGTNIKTVSIPKKGVYDVRLVHFEYWGGAELEFSVAKGTHSTFDPAVFRLVGDPASGVTTAENWDDIEFAWEESDGVVAITKYIGTSGNVVVPELIGGIPVVTIGSGAFCDNKLIRNVVLPSGVKTIDDNAFDRCSELTSVTIPNGVTDIGPSAFSHCRSLTSVVIPDSVANIGDGAFAGCENLTDIAMPNSVTNIGESTFSCCIGLTNVTISSGVTEIGDLAFNCCYSLTSVVIPEGVTRIGSEAFYGCGGLTSVVIPDSVTMIEYGAFSDCYELPSVTLPVNLAVVGDRAFMHCYSLSSVIIPGGVTNINSFAFAHCSGLTNVTISSGVTRVWDYAFDGCSGLTSVTIPDSVTEIGRLAFYGCSGLTAVHINDIAAWCRISFSDNPLSYAHTLYLNGSHVTDLVIPDGVTSIGDSAFCSCSGLTSVTIPDSVTSIGANAFSGCSGLTSVTFPVGVTSIGDRAFEGCSGVEKIVFDGDAPEIGDSCFSGVGLTCVVHVQADSAGWNVRIPGTWNGMQIRYNQLAVSFDTGEAAVGLADMNLDSDSKGTISWLPLPEWDGHVFDGWYLSGEKIEEGFVVTNDITLTAKWLAIESEAVNGVDWRFVCDDGVASVLSGKDASGVISIPCTLGGATVCKIGECCFGGDPGIVSIEIPQAVTNIGAYAFYNCTNLESVIFNEGLEKIESGAFAGCTKLKSVSLPSTLVSLGDRMAPTKVMYGACDDYNRFVSYANGFLADGTNFVASTTGLDEWSDGDSSFEASDVGGSETQFESHSAEGADWAIALFNGEKGECSFSCVLSNEWRYSNYFERDGRDVLSSASSMSSSVLRSDVKGVVSRAMGVFEGCIALENISLNSGLREIGAGAFKDCVAIRCLSIPDSVTSIGGHGECVELTYSLCYECVSDMLIINGGKPSALMSDRVISNGYSNSTYECSGFVQGCTNLSCVTLPSDLSYLGPYSFAGCTSLESIALPDSLRTINEGTFSGCSALETVKLPESLDLIGGYEFAPGITTSWCVDTLAQNGGRASTISYKQVISPRYDEDGGVYKYDTLTQNGASSCLCSYSKISVKRNADGIFNLEDMFVDHEFTTNVFSFYVAEYDDIDIDNRWQDGVDMVFVPNLSGDYIDSVGRDCLAELRDFIDASRIEPDRKRMLDRRRFCPDAPVYRFVRAETKTFAEASGVFYGCENLRAIMLPSTVRRIADYAFYDCAKLVSVNVPDSMEVVGYKAFGGRTNLPDIGAPWQCYPDLIDEILGKGCSYMELLNLFEDVCSVVLEESSGFSQDEKAYIAYAVVNSAIYALNRLCISNVGDSRQKAKESLAELFDALEVINAGSADTSKQTMAGAICVAAMNALSALAETMSQYIVTLDVNGGEGAGSVKVNNGTKVGDLPVPTRKGYEFLGWFTASTGGSRVADNAIVTGDMTLYAQWHILLPELYEVVDGAAPDGAASEYNGYLYDEKSGDVKGTIQVKVGKPGKKDGAASVKATVVVGTKKVTLKAKDKGKATIEKDGPTEIELVGGEACVIVLGAEGLAGYYGAYLIDGSRNFFASKDKGELSAANAILSKWLGSFMVIWDGGSLSVSIAAKGKVKVSGTLANGKTKVSVSTVLLVGEEWCCVSVAAQKANLAFALWLSHDGQTIVAEGLGDDVLVGKAGSLANGAAFHVDADEFAAVFGQTMLPYLPDGVPVAQKGTKWSLPKAGKVVYKNGAVDELKLGDNPCALKLTYKAKEGTFKGSFKVYTEVKGKPKATTVNVTGFLLNGIGYGTATIKGRGSVAVRIE